MGILRVDSESLLPDLHGRKTSTPDATRIRIVHKFKGSLGFRRTVPITLLNPQVVELFRAEIDDEAEADGLSLVLQPPTNSVVGAGQGSLNICIIEFSGAGVTSVPLRTNMPVNGVPVDWKTGTVIPVFGGSFTVKGFAIGTGTSVDLGGYLTSSPIARAHPNTFTGSSNVPIAAGATIGPFPVPTFATKMAVVSTEFALRSIRVEFLNQAGALIAQQDFGPGVPCQNIEIPNGAWDWRITNIGGVLITSSSAIFDLCF